MRLVLAFLPAFLLGCYGVNKKMPLNGSATTPVLFFNTLISSLILAPFILLSFYTDCLDGTVVYVPRASLEDHLKVLIKAVVVLSSWISGHFALKHLSLTITEPIKASQPMSTLPGMILLFGGQLNLFQWVGVLLSIASFYLPSLSGKKGGVHFAYNKWVFFTILSTLTGTMNGLYDEHLMCSMDVMTVQVWFNVYRCAIISFILLSLWYPSRRKDMPFQWRWNITFISVSLCVADWVYFYVLTFPDSMISVISMVCRSNVLATFLTRAIFFHEENLRDKAIDLFLVLLGMIFLYLGAKQKTK